MCLSNEPGYYLVDNGKGFGVRIESILAVQPAGKGDDGKWLKFERLTRVPIDRKMVDEKLLSREERRWLKEHNEGCKRELREELKYDRRALKWLMRQ